MSSPKKDPAYLAWIRQQPCAVCKGCLGWCSEAAHVGFESSRRGLGQKFPDRESIPLCWVHHREGKSSIHRLGPTKFFEEVGLDRDATIRKYQELYDGELSPDMRKRGYK